MFHVPVQRDLVRLGAALQQIGIMSTTVSNAGFLTALYVPLVPIAGALLLRERSHWSVWPASLGCLTGTYLLGGGSLAALTVGDLWVIASALMTPAIAMNQTMSGSHCRNDRSHRFSRADVDAIAIGRPSAASVFGETVTCPQCLNR